MRHIGFLTVCLCLAGSAAWAHPHIFVDTGLTLRFDDQGRLGAVGVVWVYDELSSMLILGDLELDGDADGELTQDERQRLQQEGSAWPEDFDGDLYLSQAGQAIALSGPQEIIVDYRDGRLIETHLRPLATPLAPQPQPVAIKVYDPFYYTFYDLAAAPKMIGRGDCEVRIERADIAAAQKLYADELELLNDEQMLDEGQSPQLGGAFADEVRVTCAAQP